MAVRVNTTDLQNAFGKDLAAKLNLYVKSGIREYWVVDLEIKIRYYALAPLLFICGVI